MKRILALAILLAAPSLAMAASDMPKKHHPAHPAVTSSTAVHTDRNASHELRAEIGSRNGAVEVQEAPQGYDPYATGVLTPPMDVPMPD